MFERQDSNSKINVFLTMEDNTVQVVPIYSMFIPGNIPNVIGQSCSNNQDLGQQPANIFNNDASNILSTGEMYTASASRVQNAPYSIMEVYDGIKDKDLAEAATRAIVDGDMTPLIKEELKYSIQSKRLKEGKPEMKVEFKEPEPDLVIFIFFSFLILLFLFF